MDEINSKRTQAEFKIYNKIRDLKKESYKRTNLSKVIEEIINNGKLYDKYYRPNRVYITRKILESIKADLGFMDYEEFLGSGKVQTTCFVDVDIITNNLNEALKELE